MSGASPDVRPLADLPVNGRKRPFIDLLERLPLASDVPAFGYAMAVLFALGGLLVRIAADPVMPAGFPFVTFFPAVILASFLFGRGPGTLAGILCGLIAWYWFVPPFGAVKMSVPVAVAMGFYTLVVATDIALVHWMQQANARLRDERERSRRLAERSDILFRELQHRISNNLQVVGGLLALQKRDVADPDARAALDEAARRLGLIGRLHRHLHDPSGEQLRFDGFVGQLTADLIDSSGRTDIHFTVEADDSIALEADAAIPVALIVAEAVSNAIEHGFAGGRAGLISIHIRDHGDAIDLTVVDNGHGLPPGFALANSDSLGLRLAQMLARQLGGEFSLTHGLGSVARLHLPR
jgi:two-component sensor histidine kinase